MRTKKQNRTRTEMAKKMIFMMHLNIINSGASLQNVWNYAQNTLRLHTSDASPFYFLLSLFAFCPFQFVCVCRGVLLHLLYGCVRLWSSGEIARPWTNVATERFFTTFHYSKSQSHAIRQRKMQLCNVRASRPRHILYYAHTANSLLSLFLFYLF